MRGRLRARLLLLLVMCVPAAHGAERVGDASIAYALQSQAQVVSALERDMLALIESSPDDERVDLYRAYDQLMGTWVQVDLLQALQEFSMSATLPLDEEEIRAHLRDHARFALWDLDNARAYLEQSSTELHRQEQVRIYEAIRSLFFEATTVISRLLTDQRVAAP